MFLLEIKFWEPLLNPLNGFLDGQARGVAFGILFVLVLILFYKVLRLGFNNSKLAGGSEVVPFQHDAKYVPERAYASDAGYDLRASVDLQIGPGERAVVPTGIHLSLPEGYAGLVIPRSGLAAKHGIGVVNGPGLIDPGYVGEIHVVLLNTDKTEVFEVHAGDRVAQLMMVPTMAMNFQDVVELPKTKRSTGGFGSTGRK